MTEAEQKQIVEYAAAQVERFADDLVSCITGKPFDSDERLDGLTPSGRF